jgi:hypothetical protein
MRLWSLHPRYLDPQGLVALWREALLAKAVLGGKTKGYRQHPQLERFRAQESPRSAINVYLAAIHAEATRRGYHFDHGKIGPVTDIPQIPVTGGQLEFEWRHLMKKLAARNKPLFRQLAGTRRAQCHPLFRRVHGAIEIWERT